MGERKVKIVAVIDSETGKYSEGLAEVEGKTKRSADVMQGIWQGVGQAITHALLATAKAALDKVTAGMQAVWGEFKTGVKDAAQFEQALAKVGVKGAENLDGIRSGLLEISNELGENLPQMVDAAGEALRRGIPEDNLIDFIRTSSKLAGASGEELTTIVNGLADTINAYRLDASEASEVADKFAIAQRSGKVAVGELSVAMGALAPIASQLGVSYEEMIAVFETGTDRGMKMRNVMSAMQSLMENILRPTGDAAAALESLGLTSETAGRMISEGGLVRFLTQVGPEGLEKLAGSASELSLMLAILGQDAGDSFNQTLGQLQNSVGAVDKAFEQVESTTIERWNDLFYRFRNMMMEIGAPVNEYLGDMLDVINEKLSSRFPEIGAKLKEVISRFIAGGVSDEEQEAINQAVADGKMTAEEAMAKLYAAGPGEQLINKIGDWAGNVAENVLADLDEYLNSGGNFGEMAGEWINSGLDALIPYLYDAAAFIGKHLIGFLWEVWSQNPITEWMASPFNSDTFKSPDSYLSSEDIGFAGYANGGIVPGGYGGGDRVPALLEPGEMVLTKEQVLRLGPSAGSGQGDINININGYDKDPRELAREIQRVLREEERMGRGLSRMAPEYGI